MTLQRLKEEHSFVYETLKSKLSHKEVVSLVSFGARGPRQQAVVDLIATVLRHPIV